MRCGGLLCQLEHVAGAPHEVSICLTPIAHWHHVQDTAALIIATITLCLPQASLTVSDQATASHPPDPSASSTSSSSTSQPSTISHKQVVQLFGTVPPLEARAGAEPPAALSAQVAGTLRKAKTAIVKSRASQCAVELAGDETQQHQQQHEHQHQQQQEGPAVSRWQDDVMDVALGGGVVVLGQRQTLDLISAICSANVGPASPARPLLLLLHALAQADLGCTQCQT
jgi:hypothetical protein